MHPRPYTDADFAAVQAALAGWIALGGDGAYCHPGEIAHRIYGEAPDAPPPEERVLLWMAGDEIAGVAICGRFGAAFDLFVPPLAGRGPAEAAMLQEAAARTARLMPPDREDRAVLTDVFGRDVVRQAHLERLGFARYRTWDWVTARGLQDDPPEAPLPLGFAIRGATLGDCAQLALARNEAFGSGWTAEGYRNQVMRGPGYRPERELVAVAPDGQIAAFGVLWVDGLNRTGQLEPIGTRPTFRRLGLARALLCHGLRELRRQGVRCARITHDAANLPALELYRGLGFVKADETLGYRRGG